MSMLVHVVLGSIQLCFSGWHIVSKVASKNGANPYIFASYRAIGTLLLMYSLVKIRKKKVSLQRSDFPILFVMGFCSFVNSGNNNCAYFICYIDEVLVILSNVVCYHSFYNISNAIYSSSAL